MTSAEDDNILFVSCGLIIETQNSADGEAKSQQVNKIEGIILFLKKLGNLTRIDSSSFLFKWLKEKGTNLVDVSDRSNAQKIRNLVHQDPEKEMARR